MEKQAWLLIQELYLFHNLVALRYVLDKFLGNCIMMKQWAVAQK